MKTFLGEPVQEGVGDDDAQRTALGDGSNSLGQADEDEADLVEAKIFLAGGDLQPIPHRGGTAGDHPDDVPPHVHAIARSLERDPRPDGARLHRRTTPRGRLFRRCQRVGAAAPNAVIVCSELCAALSLRDLATKEPRVVSDGKVLDLGTHRLRFLMTPQVNQWDSLMAYEETTRTLFRNDLFSSLGTEAVTDKDCSREAPGAARELGYQADDRKNLLQVLDKLAPLDLKIVAPTHGPTLTAHADELLRSFRDNALALA